MDLVSLASMAEDHSLFKREAESEVNVDYFIHEGCRHCSVDSSAPSIMPCKVRVPSTPSTLLLIFNDLCHAEKIKINKEAGIGPFL